MFQIYTAEGVTVSIFSMMGKLERTLLGGLVVVTAALIKTVVSM
jgi:hypothetical protein